jgi:hypothetical protein
LTTTQSLTSTLPSVASLILRIEVACGIRAPVMNRDKAGGETPIRLANSAWDRPFSFSHSDSFIHIDYHDLRVTTRLTVRRYPQQLQKSNEIGGFPYNVKIALDQALPIRHCWSCGEVIFWLSRSLLRKAFPPIDLGRASGSVPFSGEGTEHEIQIGPQIRLCVSGPASRCRGQLPLLLAFPKASPARSY